MTLNWKSCRESSELNEAATNFILSCAEQSIARHDRFQIVLAGGQTPAPVYERLGRATTDWSAWLIYFSDERYVTADDPRRNSRMAQECLLNHVPVPSIQIHTIDATDCIAHSSIRYGDLVRTITPFDPVMLGVGEDGHTANLFPAQPIDPDVWCVAVHGAPKPTTERISLGLRALRAIEQVLVMASGYAKQKAINAWRPGMLTPINVVTTGLDGLVLLHRSVQGDRSDHTGWSKPLIRAQALLARRPSVQSKEVQVSLESRSRPRGRVVYRR